MLTYMLSDDISFWDSDPGCGGRVLIGTFLCRGSGSDACYDRGIPFFGENGF